MAIESIDLNFIHPKMMNMLQRLLLTTLLAFAAICVQAQSDTPLLSADQPHSQLSRSALQHNSVFFTDQENQVYYIDFEATKSKVVEVKLWKNDTELVQKELTYDLPYNAIYELGVKDLAAGQYSIELTTIEGDGIFRFFTIDNGPQKSSAEK